MACTNADESPTLDQTTLYDVLTPDTLESLDTGSARNMKRTLKQARERGLVEVLLLVKTKPRSVHILENTMQDDESDWLRVNILWRV